MKGEIIDSLHSFFDILGDQEIYQPGIFFKNKHRKVRSDDFIVFGGASLVLQGRIDYTSDIDMFSPVLNRYIVSSSIRKAGYYPNYETFNRLGLEWVEFYLEGMKYHFFNENGLQNLIAKPVRKKKAIKICDMKISVRPYRHLLRDAKKVINDDEVMPTHKLKYRYRFRELCGIPKLFRTYFLVSYNPFQT